MIVTGVENFTVGFLSLIINYSILTIWLKWNFCIMLFLMNSFRYAYIMLFLMNSFRYAAVKNGHSCFCLGQVEEKNRLNLSFCNVRYVLNYVLFKADT